MGQGKAGWWVAGIAAGIVLISVGYGMGRRAGAQSSNPQSVLSPAGAPPAIQIEPIQPQAELAAITVTPTPAPTASKEETASTASPAVPPLEDSARVREVQQALKAAGFDPGPVDGKMGHRTQTAVRDFQRSQGLEPDGKVGPKTWAKLEPHLTKQSTSD